MTCSQRSEPHILATSARYGLLPLALICAANFCSPVLAQGFQPAEVEKHIRAMDGVKVKLFAAEPQVRQAIFVKCDDRGRLWTIQYLQYPNPAGLKRVKVDRWSRTEYDRVPEPPPRGPRGADRITILTDTDGDGHADGAKDFVDGLNLVTGVEFGNGGVYVLQVPYLLFYPDRNRDDVPDGDPEVLLSGFGMQDAQAMANHLTWGPDGWLYGVNGSTTTCNIRGIEFQQGCWRYHPRTKKFELFCEGGLNCYGLTFDANGELFYSTNGGPFVHAVQGGYFYKSFGKHGPLHNLFAYHYFPQQECDAVPGGPPTGGTIYLGDSLPDTLRGQFVAGNFLSHTVSWWNFKPKGSSFRATYGGVLFDTHDTWSGPTDFCIGPDGCAYVSDFYDQRSAHPDPDANWDRTNGRIYRVEPSSGVTAAKCDIAALTSDQLVDLTTGDNHWFACRARVELASRSDRTIVPRLKKIALEAKEPHHALQALWALEVTTGLDDELAVELIHHPYPYMRFWVARLLGDKGSVSPKAGAGLLHLARNEMSPVVLAQLAASAKRLNGSQGLPIVTALLDRESGSNDTRIPWLLWWAIENKSLTDTTELLEMFRQPVNWAKPMWRDNSLRLMRRWTAEGPAASYESCAKLLKTAPVDQHLQALEAVRLGLAERSQGFEEITQGGLFATQAEHPSLAISRKKREYQPLTGKLQKTLLTQWQTHPTDELALELALRTEDSSPYEFLRAQLATSALPASKQLMFLKLAREFGRQDLVPLLLPLIGVHTSPEVFQATLDVLTRFDQREIADRLTHLYSELPNDRRRAAREVLFQRQASALEFLKRVDRREFSSQEIPIEQVRALANHHSPEIDALVRKHWGNIGPGSTEEKLATIRRLSNDLRAAPGNAANGQVLFTKHCAVCHQLHGQGAKIGPDLTTANRQDQAALLANIVDPSAVIRREYVSYLITTGSGQVLTGLIAEQDAATVTLLSAENKRVKVQRGEIDEIIESSVSLMPEKQLESLTAQELRDLFSYLQQ